MNTLIKKIAPLVLVGAGIFGMVRCATQPSKISTPTQEQIQSSPIKKNDRWVDLKNGFSAESYKVHENILLVTEAYLGESMLIKTGENYEGIKTNKYHTTPTEVFDSTYDEFCRAIDNGDKFITEMETELFLNEIYTSMEKIIWLEEE